MKFDAWPVEPPGLGSGPLSTCTMSVQPRRARWHARPFPTMPAPMTTTRALLGMWLMALDISVRPDASQLIYLTATRHDECRLVLPGGASGDTRRAPP